MLLDGVVKERRDAREDIMWSVHGDGRSFGRRDETLVLPEVSPEEAVPGAPQALRP